MTLKDSWWMHSTGIELRTGRKWSVSQVSRVTTQTCWHCWNHNCRAPRPWNGWTSKVHNIIQTRQKIHDSGRKGEAELRMAQLVQMRSQGASTKWNLLEKKLTWSDIWQMEPVPISFLLRSVYDIPPTPANLHRWKLTEDPSCTLCGKRRTLELALSFCSTALSQGRYR